MLEARVAALCRPVTMTSHDRERDGHVGPAPRQVAARSTICSTILGMRVCPVIWFCVTVRAHGPKGVLQVPESVSVAWCRLPSWRTVWQSDNDGILRRRLLRFGCRIDDRAAFMHRIQCFVLEIKKDRDATNLCSFDLSYSKRLQAEFSVFRGLKIRGSQGVLLTHYPQRPLQPASVYMTRLYYKI